MKNVFLKNGDLYINANEITAIERVGDEWKINIRKGQFAKFTIGEDEFNSIIKNSKIIGGRKK